MDDFKNKSLIITIDGQSATGKNTLGNLLAEKLNMSFIDVGLLFRLYAYNYNVNPNSIHHISIDDFFYINEETILYKGINIYRELKSEETAKIASFLGKNKSITDRIIEDIKGMPSKTYTAKNSLGNIFTGRIGGTKIFPKANLKIYLKATLNVRVDRRYNELIKSNLNVEYSKVYQSIKERDNRRFIPAKDSITIDTSSMGIYELLDTCLSLVEKNIPNIIKTR